MSPQATEYDHGTASSVVGAVSNKKAEDIFILKTVTKKAFRVQRKAQRPYKPICRRRNILLSNQIKLKIMKERNQKPTGRTILSGLVIMFITAALFSSCKKNAAVATAPAGGDIYKVAEII